MVYKFEWYVIFSRAKTTLSITMSTDFRVALGAGGAAGTAVDIALFPLDTVKTRLQSQHGFWKSGGFRGVYSGLFSAAVGSAPTAAVFFVAYETCKTALSSLTDARFESVGHMAAASAGEVCACLLRVPVEVVKQRAQALATGSSIASFRHTWNSEGFRGFYRGYFSTVVREVPFSIIQFPLWEYLKSEVSRRTQQPITASQSSACGALAGGISAALTTPLDVVKTRIMLAEKSSRIAKGDISYVIRTIYRQEGFRGLFSGVAPRVLWISIGGSIFLGVYEKVKISLSKLL